MAIRFGTDGWRAVIGGDFTPENVAAVAQGFADVYSLAQGEPALAKVGGAPKSAAPDTPRPSLKEFSRPVVIGYDRRRQSKESAELIARVLAGNHIPVQLARDFCPTPCVSWLVKTKQAATGIMVTASHNPPQWNGIKFKESYGGAASAQYLAPIEEKIEENFRDKKVPKQADIADNKQFQYFNPHKEYLEALSQLVDLNAIRKAGFKILYEPMYGAGSGFLEKLLGGGVETLHGEADPDFGGIHPEPIRPYVDAAMEKMRSGKFSVCIITDGDADRIGAVDEHGNYVTSHEIFALLLKHLVENRQLKGKVLKSISTTVMIDRLCAKYGLALGVTPIGFKYLSPAMREPGVLMGGEESGGIGMPHHICERDGLYCGLLLLEMMAVRGKKLGELVADLQKEVGPTFYKRIDLKLPKEQIEKLKLKLAAYQPAELAGKKFRRRTLIDGCHFAMEDGSWLLIRPSGTEPLLRTYAEAPTREQVDKLLQEAQNLI